MGRHAFDLWLEEKGFGVVTPAEGAAEVPPPSFVAELDLADPEDDDESIFSDLGKPGDRLENTELVAAAFRAAGSPRYQDVKLKAAGRGHRRDPTYREIALQQAKRVNASVAW